VKTTTVIQKRILDIDRPDGKYKTKQHFCNTYWRWKS